MADKTKTEAAYVLKPAQHRSIAAAISGTQDSRAQVATFRGAIAGAVSSALKGKPLPMPDAERIADEVESDLRKRGYPAATIKVKKSRALSMARCAPILPQAFERCKQLRESLSDVLKFCAVLKRTKFALGDAVQAFTQEKKPNYAASAALHVSALLGMKQLKSLPFTSTKAKRQLRDWAAEYGIKVSAKALQNVG